MSHRDTRDWRQRMKEMEDGNSKKNDSLELGDSWKAMPRRTEVVANRSKHLYRLHREDMHTKENLFEVLMEVRPTQENSNNQEKQRNYVSPTEKEFVSSLSTSNHTEDLSSEASEVTEQLSFTNFLPSNDKRNTQITSTPYHKADVNQQYTTNKIHPTDVPCSPKKNMQRTSFHRNNESCITPRSSRVLIDASSNCQLVLQSSQEPFAEIIPNNNIIIMSQIPVLSPIVSSSLNEQENLLTSDEDDEQQKISTKPPYTVEIPNPQIVPISSGSIENGKQNEESNPKVPEQKQLVDPNAAELQNISKLLVPEQPVTSNVNEISSCPITNDKTLAIHSHENSRKSRQQLRNSENTQTVENDQVANKVIKKRLSKESRKRKSSKSQMDNEQDDINQPHDVPTSSNDLPSAPDNFETSDINDKVKKGVKRSRKQYERPAKKQRLQVDEDKQVDHQSMDFNQSTDGVIPANDRPVGVQDKVDKIVTRSRNRQPAIRSDKKRVYNKKNKSVNATDATKKGRVSKRKSKWNFHAFSTYDPLKKRDIVPGTRHSTRTRRVPDSSVIAFLIPEKKRQVSSKNKSILTRTKKAHDPTVESSQAGSNEERIETVKGSQVDHQHRDRALPGVHENIVNILLNGEPTPLQSTIFNGVEIASGFQIEDSSKNYTLYYAPPFESNRSHGYMKLNAHSSKTVSRIRSDLWITVLSGSCDLLINGEFSTVNTGSTVNMKGGTKYGLRNNSDQPTLIFFVFNC